MSPHNITPSICIIGDLTLDTVTHLTHVDLPSLDTSIYERTSIELSFGGTAVNPAIAASHLGFSSVSLIGKIGVDPVAKEPDLAGKSFIDYLTNHNVHLFLKEDAEFKTGQTVIMYFSGDKRILVADRAANGSFTLQDVTPDLLNVVATCDILFVSGYWLMNPEQAKATAALMEHAARNGALVVFDVVPHKIYQILEFSEFIKYTKDAHVLVSETNTMIRVFQDTSRFDAQRQVKDIAETILQNYHYDTVIFMPSNDVQHVYNRKGLISTEKTGYSQSQPIQKRGYIDRSTIKILFNHFARIKNHS